MDIKEAKVVLSSIYGMMSPEVQKAIDTANKSMTRDEELSNTHAVKITSDDIKKLNNTDSFNVCGDCPRLIFKDYYHCEGFCSTLRTYRSFYSPCYFKEDNNDVLDKQ